MIARNIKPTLNQLLDSIVVHAGSESFPLAKDIQAVTLPAIVQLLAQSR